MFVQTFAPVHDYGADAQTLHAVVACDQLLDEAALSASPLTVRRSYGDILVSQTDPPDIRLLLDLDLTRPFPGLVSLADHPTVYGAFDKIASLLRSSGHDVDGERWLSFL